MTAKDLFSRQAADYAKYRPSYPDTLFAYLAGLPARRELAWDCGTGSGQAAVQLADRFGLVVGTDPSERQLEHATARANVRYQRATAEDSPLAAGSVDLVTVAQAFHWFQHERFYEQVRRVCRPQGAFLAVWSYAICNVTPEIDAIVHRYYDGIVGPYWEPERRLVETAYRTIPFPFKEITPPAFVLEVSWNADHFFGYLASWSATQTAVQKLGRDPRAEIEAPLRAAWGDVARLLRWPLTLRIGSVGA